jgi:hypothetical protein
MISFFIRGQTLTVSSPTVAADSVNYLTAKFTFQTSDWDGLEKVAHFRCGELYAEIGLTDDEIRSEDGLNLTAGEWTVSVTGHRTEGGELIRRATTNTATLTVVPSGIGDDGEPLPDLASYGETILAEVKSIHSEVDEQLRENLSDVSTLLDANEADVDARLDENESAVARMLGAVKNRRDDSFIQFWAGTEAQFEEAEKSADTIYLVDLLGGGET